LACDVDVAALIDNTKLQTPLIDANGRLNGYLGSDRAGARSIPKKAE
jgi:hypothetical protein